MPQDSAADVGRARGTPLTTSSALKVSAELPGLSEVLVSSSWMILFHSHLVYKALRSLGSEEELLRSTWMVLGLVAAGFTEAALEAMPS